MHPARGKTVLSCQKEQSDNEQFLVLIRRLSPDTIFKSYKDLCQYFGIEPIGGNSKKNFLAELSRYCTCVKIEKSNKYIITNIFDSPLFKIDKRFLNSKYYSMCGYLLLVFLAERYSQDENEKRCYLTKREIMGIISICNSYYSNAYSNSKSIEEELNKDSESIYFKEIVISYLYKQIQKILDALHSRKLLTFNKVIMVKHMSKEAHEASDEEARLRNEYYNVILKKYSLKSISAIRLRNDKKEIYNDIDEHLDFKHYEAIKFNLANDLASNAEHLRSTANLTNDCRTKVNSLVCGELYNLVFNKIVNIRNNEPKPFNILQAINKFTAESFEKEINEMIEEHLSKGTIVPPVKDNRRWGFNSDDDIVNYRIESLIDTFIRIDGDSGVEFLCQ